MLIYYFEVYNNKTGEIKYHNWYYHYDVFMNELNSWLEILGPGATIQTKLEYLVFR